MWDPVKGGSSMLESVEIVELRELLAFLLSQFPMGHRNHRSFIPHGSQW